MVSFTAMITKEDDMFIAKCLEVGTVSQGHSLEKALANLKEATELYLEENPKPEAFFTKFEVGNVKA